MKYVYYLHPDMQPPLADLTTAGGRNSGTVTPTCLSEIKLRGKRGKRIAASRPRKHYTDRSDLFPWSVDGWEAYSSTEGYNMKTELDFYLLDLREIDNLKAEGKIQDWGYMQKHGDRPGDTRTSFYILPLGVKDKYSAS